MKLKKILIIVPMIYACDFGKPDFQKFEITKTGSPQSMTIKPYKDNNNVVIVKYEGTVNTNYKLKIDFFSTHSTPYNTEMIVVSNGTVKGEWRRDFYGNKTNGSVVVTYLPDDQSSNGKVDLQVAIE